MACLNLFCRKAHLLTIRSNKTLLAVLVIFCRYKNLIRVGGVLLLFFIAAQKIHAQPDAALRKSHHIFSETDGLRDRNITGMFFDNDGVGWLSCMDGLFIFDGSIFHRASLFFPALKEKFDSPIQSIFYEPAEDKVIIIKVENNRLVFYNFNKAAYFKSAAKSLSVFFKESQDGEAFTIIRYKGDYLYNLNEELNVLSSSGNQFKKLHFKIAAYGIMEGDKEYVYFENDNILFYFKKCQDNYSIGKLGPMTREERFTLFEGKKCIKKWGKIIASKHWENICKINNGEAIGTQDIKPNTHGYTVTDPHGNIFLYSTSGLIEFYNQTENAFTPLFQKYEPRGIYYSAASDKGIVATSNGLFYFSKNGFYTKPASTIGPGNFLFTSLKTASGDLFFFNGFNNEPSFVTDTLLKQVTPFSLNYPLKINACCMAANNQLYIADEKLYRGMIINKRPVLDPIPFFSDSSLITALLYDRKSTQLFIATQKGLYRLRDQPPYHATLLGIGDFTSLDTLHNQLLAGTRTKGLFFYNRFDGVLTNVFDEKKGLPHNTIFSVLVDDSRDLIWIGTKNGLSIYNMELKQPFNYTESDGLAHNEFNRNSTFHTPNYQWIVMGGLKGLNLVRTDLVIKSSPSSLHQAILSATVTYENGKDVFLPLYGNDDNRIELEPSVKAIRLLSKKSSTNNLTFLAYQIDDKEWQYISAKTDIVLPNPASGSLKVRIKNIGADANSGNECILHFYIKEIWYKTWWFLISAGLLFLGIIYIYLKWRMKLLAVESEREINAQKEKLFGIIAHDLRNPLKTYQGMTSVLSYLIKHKKHDEMMKAAAELDQIGSQLDVLVENLLNWSLAQQSSLTPNFSNFELDHVIQKVLPLYQTMAKYKGTEIKFAQNGVCTVWADEQMVSLIIRNLLDNAIKNTPDSSTVTMLLATIDNHVSLTISNAINEDNIEVIKTRFDEFSAGNSRPNSGLGLKFVSFASELLQLTTILKVEGEMAVCVIQFPKIQNNHI